MINVFTAMKHRFAVHQARPIDLLCVPFPTQQCIAPNALQGCISMHSAASCGTQKVLCKATYIVTRKH